MNQKYFQSFEMTYHYDVKTDKKVKLIVGFKESFIIWVGCASIQMFEFLKENFHTSGAEE